MITEIPRISNKGLTNLLSAVWSLKVRLKVVVPFTLSIPGRCDGYHLRLLHRAVAQFDPHSRRFTWQMKIG